MKYPVRSLLLALLAVGAVHANPQDSSFQRSFPVSFLSAHNTYFVNEGNGGINKVVNANKSQVGDWETMTMLSIQEGCVKNHSYVFIRSGNGFYWGAFPDGRLLVDRSQIGQWEKFLLINHSDAHGCLANNDVISLKAVYNNRYVVAESNGGAKVNRDNAGAWEQFTVKMKDGDNPASTSSTSNISAPVTQQSLEQQRLQLAAAKKSADQLAKSLPGAFSALIWKKQNSPVHYWSMANGQPLSGKYIGPAVDDQWQLLGPGDLNGDNKDDIIWRRLSTGQVLAWFSPDGTKRAKIGPVVGREWRLAGVGDLNGDGSDDLIWHRQDGRVLYWPMKYAKPQAPVTVGKPVPKEWKLAGAGDVNNDGTDDIIWKDQNGQAQYWQMQNGQPRAIRKMGNSVGPEWTLIGFGDF